MPDMFIANATKKFFEFHYRPVEAQGNRVQRIPPGGQIRIPNLSTPDIDAIVAQHQAYGFTPVDEIDRTKAFGGVCFSVDRKISVDKITRAMSRTEAALIEQGKRIRTESAVAENNALQESLQESGRPEGLKTLEMSVIEETKDTSGMSEGVRVDNSNDGKGGGKSRKK